MHFPGRERLMKCFISKDLNPNFLYPEVMTLSLFLCLCFCFCFQGPFIRNVFKSVFDNIFCQPFMSKLLHKDYCGQLYVFVPWWSHNIHIYVIFKYLHNFCGNDFMHPSLPMVRGVLQCSMKNLLQFPWTSGHRYTVGFQVPRDL